jgi:hypothetical protein
MVPIKNIASHVGILRGSVGDIAWGKSRVGVWGILRGVLRAVCVGDIAWERGVSRAWEYFWFPHPLF